MSGHGVVRGSEAAAASRRARPAKAMSCGLTNEATASHGPSFDAAASSSNSSTTCSANTPSRTVPQSAFAAPWGSRPIQPENPNGSSRSAFR